MFLIRLWLGCYIFKEELFLRAAAATAELAFIQEEGETKKKWCQNSYLKKNKGYLIAKSINARFLACNNSNSYQNFLRLDEDLFQQIVRHRIEKRHTASGGYFTRFKVGHIYSSITTGKTYQSLFCGFRVASNTIVSIIPTRCDAISKEFVEEFIKCSSSAEE